jgi:hypothetical protein
MSADGVIAFRRRGITIGEAYFDEAPASVERVDLMRVVGAFTPPGEGARELHTLVLDLSADEDALFEQMSKDTRSKIRRAMQKDPLTVSAVPEPSAAEVDDFGDFYDRFASAHSVSLAFRPRLHALAERGGLVITAVSGEDGESLVRHAYVAARGRGFMLYSGSVLDQSGDSGVRNLIGRANRYLHWHDIRLFRERGFDLYDFGGLDVTGRNEKTAGIARFKQGFGGEVRPVYSATSARSALGAVVKRVLGLRGVEF